MAQRSLIPAVEHRLKGGRLFNNCSVVTGVFAVESSANLSVRELLAMWRIRPVDMVYALDKTSEPLDVSS